MGAGVKHCVDVRTASGGLLNARRSHKRWSRLLALSLPLRSNCRTFPSQAQKRHQTAVPARRFRSNPSSAFTSTKGEIKSAHEMNGRMQRPVWDGFASLYLITALLAVYAPLTEVFAIVAKYTVVILPYSGPRALDDLTGIKFDERMNLDPYRPSSGKSVNGNFFHRPCVESSRGTRVVNDIAASDVNPVVQVAAARCGDVGAERKVCIAMHGDRAYCPVTNTMRNRAFPDSMRLYAAAAFSRGTASTKG